MNEGHFSESWSIDPSVQVSRRRKLTPIGQKMIQDLNCAPIGKKEYNRNTGKIPKTVLTFWQILFLFISSLDIPFLRK